jgi:acetylornithine deacetylase/succinyl-diaminopimelate desuccinylase-like protein
VEALLKSAGGLPVNVKCLFEGQEEIGSPQLRAFLDAHPDLAACDVVLCADGGRCGDDPPGLVTGTRGGCAVEITAQGASTDLHSGMFGGAVQNPFMALATVIASLRSLDGTVLVDGFYDAVREPPDAERALARRAPFDEAEIAARLGVPALIGEPGYFVAERLGTRPTLDVLRVWGEHEGTPITPIIPRVAPARVACRLVPDQDPETIKRLLVEHVARQVVPGATITVRALPGGSAAYHLPFDHPANRAAAAALAEVTGKTPYVSRIGGSVPVLDYFRRRLGVYSIVFGFIRDDEGFHAPNEFLRLENFRRGPLATAVFLERLASLDPASLRVPASVA